MYTNLNVEITKRHYTKKYVAKELGIDINTLASKISGKTEFKLNEVKKLLELFPGTQMAYLFEKDVKQDDF